MDASKIFNAASSIEYADQAVVSKTIIKKPTGNVTLFAFAKGEELSEHSSPHDAFIQILDGKAGITVDKNTHTLGVNECIILHANIPHSLKAIEKFKMLLVMIKN